MKRWIGAWLILAGSVLATPAFATCTTFSAANSSNTTQTFGEVDDGSGNCQPKNTLWDYSSQNGAGVNTSHQVAIQSLPSQYPAGATTLTASTTGTTGATTATLTGVASNYMYLCGFSIRANATAAATGNATVTGTITGTLNFTQWTAPNASGLGVTEEVFTPCVEASATNTSIAVVSAAPGTGGVVSVSAWGYYKTTTP